MLPIMRLFNPFLTHPFRVCDFALPVNELGHVHVIVSQLHENFSYARNNHYVRIISSLHNSGTSAIETSLACLEPFTLHACTCGWWGVHECI